MHNYFSQRDRNLFLSGAILDKVLNEYASNRTREFRNKDGRTFAMEIRQLSGIYKFLVRTLAPPIACSAYSKGDDFHMWHERLEHQNKQHVLKILKQKGFDVKLMKEFYDDCMFGKMRRLHFGTRSKVNHPLNNM